MTHMPNPSNKLDEPSPENPALTTVSRYVAALTTGDTAEMDRLRGPAYVLDWVHGDAFEDGPLSADDIQKFWPAWLSGFPERDYEVTRTIAGESVVVTQWIFTGTHSRPLPPPIFHEALPPTERTIRLRGVSIYDIEAGLIQRETTYMDLATLMVELGVRV